MATTGAEDVLARLDYPMVIVTAAADGDRSGCLVGFHTQCSIDPLHYLVCISETNHTSKVAMRATALGVHFLTKEDRDLSELFGEHTSDDIDKFAHCDWKEGPLGVPILDLKGGWLAGPILERHPVGDHIAMVVDAVASGAAENFQQLGFQQVKDMEPGHPA